MTDVTALPSHVSYARVVTPSTTYHAYTLQYVAPNVILHVAGSQFALNDVAVSETVEGWRVAGTNGITGEPEVWSVRKLACGCNRGISTTRPEDVPT